MFIEKRVENEVTSKRQVKSEHDSERNTCAIGGETVNYSSTLENVWKEDMMIGSVRNGQNAKPSE